MLLGSHDRGPKVDGRQPDSKQHVRRALIHVLISIAQSPAIDVVGDREGGKRSQREWNQDVEVQEQVRQVEVNRLGAVELRSSLGVGEDVVLDNVPGHDRQFAVV